jgi:hypothetical protein
LCCHVPDRLAVPISQTWQTPTSAGLLIMREPHSWARRSENDPFAARKLIHPRA